MKNQFSVPQVITAYGDTYIEVRQQRYGHPILILDDSAPVEWVVHRPLCADDLLPLTQANGIILLGTGGKQQFYAPEILAPLLSLGKPVELMTTAAACRTFNLLIEEGRQVVAALLPISYLS